MNLFRLHICHAVMLFIKQAFVITFVILSCVGCSGDQAREVTVVGYNYTVRPMTFSVGSVAGHLYTGEGEEAFCVAQLSIRMGLNRLIGPITEPLSNTNVV